MNTTKTPYTEIEKIIENKLSALFEEFDLDKDEIEEVRTETYKAFGWKFDPFPENEEDEETTELYEPNTYEPSIERGWAFF